MGIKKQKRKSKFSQKNVAKIEACSAIDETLLFSFRHITSCKNYNFHYFENQKQNGELSRLVIALETKLCELSKLTWAELNSKDKKSGMEYLPVSIMDKSFLNHLEIIFPKDEKLPVIRFNAQNSRLILKRGTKCGRVAHILAIDWNMKLYEH